MKKIIGTLFLILVFCGAASAQSSQVKIALGGTYANGTITITPVLPAEQAHAIKTAYLDTGGAALLQTLSPGITYQIVTCTSTGATCLAATVNPNGATQDITSTLQANPFSGGGSGTPGGTTGQTQYNNAGAFGGYTPSGDVTVVPSTGVETVKGINGTLMSGLATGIVKNTTTTGVPSIATGADLPTAIPIASVGSAGLSATGCTAIASTGAITSTTCGVTTSPLSQFAATTSAQLAGVLSDETGTGTAVFNTSPTLVTPTLGAASATSLTLTGATAGFFQCTQGSANGHATANTFTEECPAAVTAYEVLVPAAAASGIRTWTNASGVVTESITATTGSGSVVLATTPTLVTPVLGAATGTSLT